MLFYFRYFTMIFSPPAYAFGFLLPPLMLLRADAALMPMPFDYAIDSAADAFLPYAFVAVTLLS